MFVSTNINVFLYPSSVLDYYETALKLKIFVPLPHHH